MRIIREAESNTPELDKLGNDPEWNKTHSSLPGNKGVDVAVAAEDFKKIIHRLAADASAAKKKAGRFMGPGVVAAFKKDLDRVPINL